jgi:membrane associated rhomboid family serine protease
MAYYNSGNSIQRNSPIVFNLIIINVLVFLAQKVFDKGNGGALSEKLAIHHYASDFFEPYQVVTNIFAHGSIGHIFFNMFALYTFGVWLERVWGHKRFLIFYLICGLFAGIIQMLFLSPETGYRLTDEGIRVLSSEGALGASGAIMGLFAAFAYLFPNTELMMLFLPVPIKAKYMVAIMVAIDLFGQFGPVKTNMGHFAHLSGLAMGFALVLIFNKTNKKTFY